MTLRCKKCGHEWTDESRTSCPHCDSTDVRKLVYEVPVEEKKEPEPEPPQPEETTEEKKTSEE